jgi:hypothetical protein
VMVLPLSIFTKICIRISTPKAEHKSERSNISVEGRLYCNIAAPNHYGTIGIILQNMRS